jgi:hypothetical protein
MNALEAGQYEVYAVLQSEGLCACKNEELSGLIRGINQRTEMQIKPSLFRILW